MILNKILSCQILFFLKYHWYTWTYLNLAWFILIYRISLPALLAPPNEEINQWIGLSQNWNRKSDISMGKPWFPVKIFPKTMDKHKRTQALIQGDNECPKCQHNVDPPSHQNCHKSSRYLVYCQNFRGTWRVQVLEWCMILNKILSCQILFFLNIIDIHGHTLI